MTGFRKGNKPIKPDIDEMMALQESIMVDLEEAHTPDEDD
jgi:hypothetical protein